MIVDRTYDACACVIINYDLAYSRAENSLSDAVRRPCVLRRQKRGDNGMVKCQYKYGLILLDCKNVRFSRSILILVYR